MTKYLDLDGLKHYNQTLNTKLDGKFVNLTTKGKANGVASLDANGKIPLAQLGNLDTTVAEVVSALPTTNIKKHIYMVKSAETTNQNIYKEYIYTGDTSATYDASKWEELGEFKSAVDLTPYSKKTETVKGLRQGAYDNNVLLIIDKADNTTSELNIIAAKANVNGVGGTAGVMSATDKTNLDKLVADTYPFGITSFSNTSGGTLEKGTTKSFNLNWSYKNTDYNPIKSQSVSGGSLSAATSVAPGTTTLAIANLTDNGKTAAKTFTYTLTAVGGSTTKTANTSVTFVHRSYAGVVAASKTSLTATEIKALTNQAVQNSKSRTLSFTQNNQKIAYCYPAYFGNLSSIKDGNGFQGFSGYIKSTVDVDGVTYNVYLSANAATASGSYTFA
nr:MAG TPA: hypothetical protein [Crassvirales sp.]